MRFFNTTGPIKPTRHYHIPPLDRLRLGELRRLVAEERYFVLHAPRQTGKTSALLALQDLLNAEGDYRCVYVNVEGAQAMREDVERATRVVLGQVARRARLVGDDFLTNAWPQIWAEHRDGALGEALACWAEAAEKPLVLLIDEIDSLVGDTLLSVLRQLRAGYDLRPDGFPQSVVLCGVRDVRDYRIHSSSANTMIAGGSAFNVKAKSLRLGDFCRDEVLGLLGQHTNETGQAFADAALDAVWTRTQGQPWLVNALAYREYGLGRGRTDLLVIWPEEGRGEPCGATPPPGGRRKYVVECKVLRKSMERTVAEGVEQTAGYMDRCGAQDGHLVVFDRREGRSWDEKVFRLARTAQSGAEIAVWGM